MASSTSTLPPTPTPTPTKATITISDANPNPNHDLFTVNFNATHTIETTVTSDPTTVTRWLTTLTLPTPHPIIGLDVEWRPNFGRQYDNPIATLQLSTSSSCLIFQLLHSPTIPLKLSQFLASETLTFVGVGIRSDVEQLLGDYDLKVKNVLDLKELVMEKIEGAKKGIGLKELARIVLNVEVNKPKSVTLSRWDCEWLSFAQIQYACVDAFLSFEIGNKLMSLPSLHSNSSAI